MITIKPISGNDVTSYIPELARLRIEVFREFPYLYDGDMTYEEKYLKTYTRSNETIIVLALDGDKVIGASTGMPMEMETEEVKEPFIQHDYHPSEIFYFGESVLNRKYRGKGIGVRFFDEREAHVRKLGRFRYTAFCAVNRPSDHPRRPVDYKPLDQFWQNRGYHKYPQLRTTFSWKDLDENQESDKEMIFWMSALVT